MAQFFKPSSKKRVAPKQLNCQIHDLDLKGQGVGRAQERTLFVAGALPGEKVRVKASVPAKGPIHGQLEAVLSPSEHRVEPKCKHYAVCGGCQLQHLASEQQIFDKQRALELLLQKRDLKVNQWQAPITSTPWGYRTKIRLALDARKQVKLGFRHGDSNKILNLSECPVMAKPLEALLPELQTLIARLEGKQQIGHVELQLNQGRVGLWLHQTQTWSEPDWTLIQQWLAQQEVIWLDHQKPLSYRLEAFDLTLNFRRNDFIQSNLTVNEAMVTQAIEWLALEPTDKVMDLFCGMGNFSLPLARRCAQVTGIEGVEEMVHRASENARTNQIDNAQFYHADLSKPLRKQSWWQAVDAVLLDPARAGAEQVVTELGQTKAKRVLYVSCNPTTLVRDAEILTKQGYTIEKAGVMDMFPQTHHLESMLLFSKMKG